MPDRGLTRHARLLLAVFPLIAVPAAAASAHAILVASQPPEGGTVPTGEAHFNLRFNSRIDRMRSRVVLTNPDHTQITMPISAEGKPDEINTSATLVPGCPVPVIAAVNGAQFLAR